LEICKKTFLFGNQNLSLVVKSEKPVYLVESLKIFADDMLLVKQALSGNRKSFEQIVKKYQSSVARTTISMLGQSADAEDVGQETFIRFYRSMDQYKGEAALGTYLTRIAINLSLNALKKREKRRWLSLDGKIENSTAVDDQHVEKDNKELIEMALKQLEPDFRSVVVIRLIQGYSTKETAEILDIPQGTVLSRLSRAQLKLKEMFNSTNNHHEQY